MKSSSGPPLASNFHCVAGWAVILIAVCGAPAAHAATVLYDFNVPGFTEGQVTPLLAKAPVSGPATFRADFTSSPTVGGFGIGPFQPHSLFTGQAMIEMSTPPDILRMTFNQLIDRVQVDFAVIESGRLDIITPAGTLSQQSSPQGGQYEGGTLIFSSPTPFQGLQLLAFSDANARILFAIDDVMINVVPEPDALLLVVLGAIRCLFSRSRRTAGRLVG